MPGEEFCRKALVYIGFWAACAVIGYVVIKYVFVLFLPFIIAMGIALASRPFKSFIMRKTKMTASASAAFAVALMLGALIFAFFHLFETMARELASIYDYLSTQTDLAGALLENIFSLVRKASGILPFVDFSGLTSAEKMTAFVSQLLPGLTSQLGELLAAVAKAVPYGLVFIAVAVVSAFYFSVDFDKISEFVSSAFPNNAKKVVSKAKTQMLSVAYKYVRAYLLIMLMTFTELYIGFSFLHLPYSFSLAVVVTLVDVLPVLGTGTVLIPWSAVAFAMGESFMGAGVLTLYVLVTVIRQIAEPKIVGKSIGLYPPLTLIGMYIGVKLFGIWGIFVLPATILTAKSVFEIFASNENQ